MTDDEMMSRLTSVDPSRICGWAHQMLAAQLRTSPFEWVTFFEVAGAIGRDGHGLILGVYHDEAGPTLDQIRAAYQQLMLQCSVEGRA